MPLGSYRGAISQKSSSTSNVNFHSELAELALVSREGLQTMQRKRNRQRDAEQINYLVPTPLQAAFRSRHLLNRQCDKITT